MEMILEGIDSLDVSLIMEANGEFKKGFASLKDNLAGFISVCKPFKELSDFTEKLEASLNNINEVEPKISEISDEYSFSDHYEMQNPPEGGDEKPPESVISSIALEYPMYVSALRDAILEIAKWLEQYPEVFSVGKNGITFSEDFRGVITNTGLKIKDFSQSGDEIISLMSGIKDTSSDKSEIKSHFESLWKTENLEEEKYDEAWEKFVAAFDTIGQGATGAHDSASNAIKGIKPPDDIQDETKKSGGILQTIISSLFGGKKEGVSIQSVNQDPSMIVGESLTDERGIFAMSFQDLQKLIASVIEFSGTSTAAGAQALAGIDSQQKENKPSKEQSAIIKKIQDVSPKLDKDTIVQIAAAMEESGMVDGDMSKIDVEKFKKLLMEQFDNDEEKVNALLDGLGITNSGENEDSEEKVFNIDAFADAVAKKGGDPGRSLAKIFVSNFQEEIEEEGFKLPEEDSDIDPEEKNESFNRRASLKNLLLELDMPFMYADKKMPQKGKKAVAFMALIDDIIRGNYKGEDPFTGMADTDPKEIASWFEDIEETEQFPAVSVKNIDDGMQHFAQLESGSFPSESAGERYKKMIGTGTIHEFSKKHGKSISEEQAGYELWSVVLRMAVAIEDPGDKLYKLLLDSMKYKKLIDGDPERNFSKESESIKEEFNSHVNKCFAEWEKVTMLGYKNAKADLNLEGDVFSSLMKTFSKWKSIIGGDTSGEKNKSPLDVITDLSKAGDEFKDTLIDLAIEEELMDDSGEATPPNSKDDIDDVIEVAEDELNDEEEKELRTSLKPSNESRLRETFDRWSLLAGIKMDN